MKLVGGEDHFRSAAAGHSRSTAAHVHSDFPGTPRWFDWQWDGAGPALACKLALGL